MSSIIECTRCGQKVEKKEACIDVIGRIGRPIYVCPDCYTDIVIDRVPDMHIYTSVYVPTYRGYKRRKMLIYRDEIKGLIARGAILIKNKVR